MQDLFDLFFDLLLTFHWRVFLCMGGGIAIAAATAGHIAYPPLRWAAVVLILITSAALGWRWDKASS